MPALYDPTQVQQLIDDIGDLEEAMTRHRVTVLAADKRSRRARLTALLGTVVAACGLLAAIMAISFGVRADDRADRAERDRQERTVAACVQANVTLQSIRSALVKSIIALVPPGTTLTAAQLATIDAYTVAAARELPYRDCSPEGLATYYKNPPKNPAGG